MLSIKVFFYGDVFIRFCYKYLYLRGEIIIIVVDKD